jgi:hypothetical protein
MESISGNVLRAIKRKGRGYVFTPEDMRSIGSRSAVDQALSRLAGKGEIRRLGRGIYDYPKISDRLGPLTPAPEAIAEALARTEGAQLQTSGARAANALGLTTQVPARLTFLTDGTPRSRRVGRQIIELKRAAPRKLRGAGTTAGAVLQALRYLGQQGVDEGVVRHLSRILTARDKRELKSLISAAPGWARSVVEQIVSSRARARTEQNAAIADNDEPANG